MLLPCLVSKFQHAIFIKKTRSVCVVICCLFPVVMEEGFRQSRHNTTLTVEQCMLYTNLSLGAAAANCSGFLVISANQPPFLGIFMLCEENCQIMFEGAFTWNYCLQKVCSAHLLCMTVVGTLEMMTFRNSQGAPAVLKNAATIVF